MIAKRIGIDLGTNNVRVYLPRDGIVVDEPSVVAINSSDQNIVAIGKEALSMLGRLPETLELVQPLQGGVIANFKAAQSMLKAYTNRALGRLRPFKPDMLINVPSGATSTERKAVIDAALGAGAKAAYLIEEPMAAALGARVPVAKPSGNFVIDFGGGTVEIGVLSLGGVVARASVRQGSGSIDGAISDYLRHKYNLSVGEVSAARIKHKIGSAMILRKNRKLDVNGRDLATGLPKTVTISSNELVEAIQDILEAVVLAIRGVLERTPAELVSDIIDQGIVLSGGGARLTSLDNLLARVIGVPVTIADRPQLASIRGIGLALDNLSLYQKHLAISR